MTLSTSEVSIPQAAIAINQRIQQLRKRCESAKASIPADYYDVISLPHNVKALRDAITASGLDDAVWGSMWVQIFVGNPSKTWADYSTAFTAFLDKADELSAFVVANASLIHHTMDNDGNRVYGVDMQEPEKTTLIAKLDAVLSNFEA